MKSTKDLLHIDEKETADRIEKYIQAAVNDHKAAGIILGLSGGLDSALLATLAVSALGKDKVHTYFLYDKHCEKDSKDKAFLMAEWLGLKLNTGSVENAMREKEKSAPFFKWLSDMPTFMVPIIASLYYIVVGETPYVTTLRKIEFKKSPFRRWIYDHIVNDIEAMFDDVCIERRIALEKIAKERNMLLIGAGNYSEDLTGWFTIGGVDDMPCSPIKSLYKTQVRKLSEYMQIPLAIQKRTSVPDGLKGVTDTLALGMDYEKIDVVLYGIKHGFRDDDIMEYGLTDNEIAKVRKLHHLSAWKRPAGKDKKSDIVV